MKRRTLLGASLALLVSLQNTTALAGEKVYLTSLEWPPYTGKTLKEQGVSVAVAKAAFAAVGYELVVDFFPWSRAVSLGKDPDSKYVGYFPEYYSADIEKEFHFSNNMGEGPLGFVERKDKPVPWNALTDLKDKKIGVVQDYVNTAEFDDMVARNELKAETVVSDNLNIKKVAGGRIDMAVIDENVLEYLLSTDKDLAALKDKVQFNGKLLENKQLFACFKRNVEGEKLMAIFNEGLKKIDIKAIEAAYTP